MTEHRMQDIQAIAKTAELQQISVNLSMFIFYRLASNYRTLGRVNVTGQRLQRAKY